MTFDPSRGVDGYTATEYRALLSVYTGSRVRSGSAADNYKVLAQRAIVAAQRYQNLPFQETHEFPILSAPLPPFRHYIPGMAYTPEELVAFHQHYGHDNLDDVHLSFEQFFPLDPSFVQTVNWIRTTAPSAVIRRLRELFSTDDDSSTILSTAELFSRHYQGGDIDELDVDINREVLTTEPERLLSDDRLPNGPVSPRRINAASKFFNSPQVDTSGQVSPLRRAVEDEARVRGLDPREKSVLELYIELGKPLPLEYQNYIQWLQHYDISDDTSPTGLVLRQTAPLSAERYSELERISTFNLRYFVDRNVITITDPLTGSAKRYDILTALMFIHSNNKTQPTISSPEVLNWDRLNPAHPSAYKLPQLQELSRSFGLSTSGLAATDLINNLYLVQVIPTFFTPDKWFGTTVPPVQRYAYGIVDQNCFVCYSRDELIEAFSLNQELVAPRRPELRFNIPAVRRLRWLLNRDTSTEGQQLRELIDTLVNNPVKSEVLLQFIRDIPPIPVTITSSEIVASTTYQKATRALFQELVIAAQLIQELGADPVDALEGLYKQIRSVPSLITDTFLALRAVGASETIGSLYNRIIDNDVASLHLEKILQDTGRHYLQQLHHGPRQGCRLNFTPKSVTV